MLRISVVIVVCLAAASCAPPGVPSGSSWEYELKVGSVWHWQRTLASGCASWTATSDWASVHLSADSANCVAGRGVTFFTGSDALIFENYWPNPGHSGGNPCPHQLSATQIAELGPLTEEALAASVTAAERRILHRVKQRLGNVDGAALMTDVLGWCSDLTPEDYGPAGSTRRQDTWQGGR